MNRPRPIHRLFAALVVVSLTSPCLFAAGASGGPGQAARFVRVELSGKKRILALAEVEIFSDGKNIAPTGKATQSSTLGAAVASRAVDGNVDPDFNKGGQTHTLNNGETNPWWELDLGKTTRMERIRITNRKGFESRLDGFSLLLVDADRK